MLKETIFYQKLNQNQFALDGLALIKKAMTIHVVFGINVYKDGFVMGDTRHVCTNYGLKYMESWQVRVFGNWLAKNMSDEHRKYRLTSVEDGGRFSYGLGAGGNVVYSGTSTYRWRVALQGYHSDVNAWYAWDPITKKYHWYDGKTGREISEPAQTAQKNLKKW